MATLSKDLTPEEALRVLGIALGFAEHLTSQVALGRGYKEPANRLGKYMPLAFEALDNLKAQIHERDNDGVQG